MSRSYLYRSNSSQSDISHARSIYLPVFVDFIAFSVIQAQLFIRLLQNALNNLSIAILIAPTSISNDNLLR